MNRKTNYVAKGSFGRESPIRVPMTTKIKNPKRLNRPTMCDVTFYNYFDIIGKKILLCIRNCEQ